MHEARLEQTLSKAVAGSDLAANQSVFEAAKALGGMGKSKRVQRAETAVLTIGKQKAAAATPSWSRHP